MTPFQRKDKNKGKRKKFGQSIFIRIGGKGDGIRELREKESRSGENFQLA
jgi:hypothetical protein